MPNDTLALPRRAVPWLALLAVIAASPNAREALADFFRRLLNALRLKLDARFRPALKKDFLGAGAGAGRPAWQPTARAALPPRQRESALGDTPAQRGEVRASDFTHGAFAEFEEVLPAWLSAGLQRSGFEALKPIQKKVLPLALAGRDVCGIAPTGSGKTLAFLVPGLVHAAGQPPPRSAHDGPIMLVLAPTRELAIQIEKVAESLLQPSWDAEFQTPGIGQGSRVRGMNSIVLYGGPRRSDQLSTLHRNQGTHLVVATPGRLLDFLENDKPFNLSRVSFFVLDEGDRMLDFGFEPDVTAIAAMIRKDRQMLFFSATWPPEVEAAALKYCNAGQMFETVSVQPKDAEIVDSNGLAMHGGHALPPRDIHQVVEVIEGSASDQWNTLDKKLPMLLRHLEDALGGELGETPGKALIFVGTRLAAEELGHLVARHFGLDRCGVMHGARKQEQREATLQAFRTGRIRALVATDVLGRGVDIPYVTHVVIYDFPSDIETYIHRVGRTGRNGEAGKSIAFFEPRPWYPELARELVDVLKATGQDVPEALEREASPVAEWGAGWYEGSNAPSGSQEPQWTEEWRKAAPLESDSPPLAKAEELGEWDCGGVRVWGYSANGGQSEQGRMELRAGGKLRTTWGWGEWALLPSAPHCPPPRRACPTPGGAPTPGTGEPIEGMDDSTLKEVAGPKPGAARHLSLQWGGCTDVVELNADGLGFELVSRSGRPASTYKKKTLGRALAGITL